MSEITPQGFDAFLQVDGIDGESTDKGHEKWIELLSFTWGLNQTSGGQGTPNPTGGKAQVRDLTFTKVSDASSPKLMQSCATGQHFKKVVLSCRKAGSDQQDFLKITLSTVLISGFVQGGHAQSETETTPSEQISFNFSKIQMSFADQGSDAAIVGEATLDGGN